GHGGRVGLFAHGLVAECRRRSATSPGDGGDRRVGKRYVVNVGGVAGALPRNGNVRVEANGSPGRGPCNDRYHDVGAYPRPGAGYPSPFRSASHRDGAEQASGSRDGTVGGGKPATVAEECI